MAWFFDIPYASESLLAATALAGALLVRWYITKRLHKDAAYSNWLRSVLESLDEHCCITSREGIVLEYNGAWSRFAQEHGVEDRITLGANLLELYASGDLYQGDASTVVEARFEVVAKGASRKTESDVFTEASGARRDFRIGFSPLTNAKAGEVLVVQQEVTRECEVRRRLFESKRKANTLADALETSQTSLELAMRGGELGLWHWDLETGYFELNRSWLELLGHDTLDLSADIESFRDLLHPEDAQTWTTQDAHQTGPERPYDRQFRLRRADGSWSWTHAVGRPNSLSTTGEVDSISGIFVNIDARKQAELRSSALAYIVEKSLNEVYVIDRTNKKFLEVNRGARENLGYSIEELRGMTPFDLEPDIPHEQMEQFFDQLDTGAEERVAFECSSRRKNGTRYPMLISLQASEYLGSQVYVAIINDITQRQELEQELRQAQKLESIGQLAAGVAHEINTPMQYVGNNLQFVGGCYEKLLACLEAYERLIDDVEHPSEQASAELEKIKRDNHIESIRKELPRAIDDGLEGVGRVLGIVRAMKEFSHPGNQQKRLSDLNHSVQSTATVTQNHWKTVARLDLDLDPNLPDVFCDPGAINQVFLNLIMNAADAIGERVEFQKTNELGAIHVRTRFNDEHVVIEVEDNGGGIDEEVIERIFDPFFTTKPVGKGTGQGLLALAPHRQVQHGGTIQAYSPPGQGATFRVTLPINASATVCDWSPDNIPNHHEIVPSGRSA